jgi:hypothetical protein
MMMWTFAVLRGREPYPAIAFAPSRRNKRKDPAVMRILLEMRKPRQD